MDEYKSRLEKLQQKIDSQKFHPEDSQFELHKKEYKMNNDWGTKPPERKDNGLFVDTEPEKTGRGFKIFFGIALGFFVLSIAYAAVIFLKDNSTAAGDDVSINVVGPISVGGGEKLALDVLIQNNNAVPIELVDLVVDYPEGTKSADDLITDLKRVRETVGTVNSGAIVRKTISSALFGAENSTKQINMSVEYRVQGASAIFTKQKQFDIVLNASPVRMTVSGLKEISSGQDLELELKIISNSNKKLEKVAVVVEYPFGFSFKSSDIAPAVANNFWVFDSINPNEEKIIKIKGSIQGQNAENRYFKFKSGLLNSGTTDQIGIIFNTAIHEIAIQKSFVDLAIKINDTDGENFVVQSGKDVVGILTFANNTNDIIRNLNIELYLDSSVINKSTVNAADGFYSSSENKIVWSTETAENFSEIRPRDSFNLQFRFKTYDLKQGGLPVTNPTIRLRAGVTGKRNSANNVEEKIETIAAANLKVVSDAEIAAYTARDEEAFTNFGPIPPRAEVETNYVVVFEVKNNVSNLKNAKIETVIPSYVTFNNAFYPKSAGVSYDSVTRKLVWDIGEVTFGEGYTKPARKLLLNLVLKPSISQVGTAPSLTTKTLFTATDTFADTGISNPIPNTTTKLYNTGSGNNDQNVVE